MMNIIYAECQNKHFMLSVIMLNVILLNVVAPFKCDRKTQSMENIHKHSYKILAIIDIISY